MSSTMEASAIMGKHYSDTFFFQSKNAGKNLTLKQMFEMIFGVSEIRCENSPWKQLSLVNDEEVINQSLECKGLCILRFCVRSWKGESEPNIKYCLGTAVGLVQRFIAIQNNGHNWRRTDGIRVDFSQDSLHCRSSKKSKSSWTKWANSNTSKDEFSSCRCSQWHHMKN